MSENVRKRTNLESVRRRLEGIRSRILDQVVDVEDELAEVQASREIDPADEAQQDAYEVVLGKIDDVTRAELEDVEAAIARIGAGIYGLCEDCGDPISAARLEAMPTALRCEPCQEAFEAAHAERVAARG